jgi:hypothetical protein
LKHQNLLALKTKNLCKPLLFSSLALVFLFFGFAKNGDAPTRSLPEGHMENDLGYSPCFTQNTTYQAGEELTYKLYYNWNFVWLSAGEMTFKVIDEDDQWHFQVVGKTYESYDWFFKVRDYYDTWVQKETGLPIMGIRNIEEGKYRLYDYLTYDQSRKKVHNDRGKSPTDIREHHDFKLDGCIVSILYHARNVDFSKMKPGEAFPIQIFMDKEAWPLKVRYKGREAAKNIRDLGKYNTQHFSPEVIPGRVFPDGAAINVWVTDDANRLPLMIDSPLSVGSVKAVLHKHKGLRWPVKAKV